MTEDPLTRLRSADPLRGELPAALERMPPLDRARHPSRRWAGSALVVANLVLLATVLLHGLDHAMIQERGVGALSFEVVLGAGAIASTAVLSLVVALRGDRRARLVALLAGPWIAALIVVGHFIPAWGEFSDPYKDAGVGTVSYIVAAATAAAGVALGAVAALAKHQPRSRMS